MTLAAILRNLGGLAIIGGALRIIAGFIPWQADVLWLEGLYLATDLCLLFGLVGFYLARGRETGLAGFGAFVIAASGIALIAGPDVPFLNIDIYQAGVSVIAIGLGVFSVLFLLRGLTPKAPPILWLASFVVSILGNVMGYGDQGFLAGGVLFGAGFIFAGLASLKAPASG
ncbi:hypothetical protein MNBD_ALPHA05-1046 [hydrothermal vent metagenome]|uniref:Uncharacterized protein n=1 Tax=hydrothermal vent metagenome TaxID=652676 RepID=A0A3B0STX0_9ZZZZ